MRLWDRSFLYAAPVLFALSFSVNIFAQGGQQTAISDPTSSIAVARPTNQSVAATAIEESASVELPDSPGAVQAQQQSNAGQSTNSVPAQPPQSSGQSSGIAPAPQTQEVKPQRPVGTAAAEAPRVSGITAAQPAGVAVAPAKQRRVRTLVIKVGAIAGAAVALGTTMALTMGTPSKPPGAH
jgi:hypothetical protein